VSMAGLNKAELLEKAAESLYRRLAAKFRDNAMLCGLLVGLADEEREHARRVAMLRYQAERDPDLAARVRLDEARLDELLGETESVAKQIVQSEITPTQAIAIVNTLEREFSIAHAETAAAADPWLREFFTSLAEDDVRHSALLEGWTVAGKGSVLQ